MMLLSIIVGKNGKEWFKGKDVCRILGYQDIKTTLIRRIKQEYKTNLKSLLVKEKSEDRLTAHYNEGKTVFICYAELQGDLSLACTG